MTLENEFALARAKASWKRRLEAGEVSWSEVPDEALRHLLDLHRKKRLPLWVLVLRERGQEVRWP